MDDRVGWQNTSILFSRLPGGQSRHRCAEQLLGSEMAVAPSDIDVRIAPSSLTAYLDDDNEQFALKMELFINCSPRLSFNYQGYYT